MTVPMKTTQYGLSPRTGGWDPQGDSYTDRWQGNHDNKLTTASCALTNAAEAALAQTLSALSPRRITAVRLAPGTLLRVTWPGTPLIQYRTFDDRAPEDDARLDLFNPWGFDHRIPDNGIVEVVT